MTENVAHLNLRMDVLCLTEAKSKRELRYFIINRKETMVNISSAVAIKWHAAYTG